MKNEYDLKKLKSRKNPYAKNLKQQITIRIGVDTVSYFKDLSEKTGMSYQNLINSYLTDCMIHQRKPVTSWKG